MCYRYLKRYTGPVRACILDWSGTTADRYVIAPAVVFREVFEKFGVPISMPEARLPMGLRKDLHIKAITKIPEVRQRWFDKYKAYPTQEDVNNMFKDFVPMQLDCLRKYTTLLPGAADTVKKLQNEYNIKIGSTTGFTKEMVDVLLEDAATQGYTPDASVAGDEVINGARPNPHMVYKNLDLLNVSPIQSVVKVDDTVGGVGEGLEAGCWAVGVSCYSNYMEIDSLEDEYKYSINELEEKNKKSRDILIKSGAHFVIDSIIDLPKVVDKINDALSEGKTPQDVNFMSID
tara:strand:- start:378 stop:1244 length:867 start_codon:yes stop_codon:yes gene_type:complete